MTPVRPPPPPEPSRRAERDADASGSAAPDSGRHRRLLLPLAFAILLAAGLAVPGHLRASYAVAGAGTLILAAGWRWRRRGGSNGKPAVGRRLDARVLLPLLFVLGVGWWLYRPVLKAGFMGDDPRLLRSAAEHGLGRHFVSPEVWRPLSGSFLTPWLVLSLGFDLALAGLEAHWFYLHHLLSLAGVAILLYALLLELAPARIAGTALLWFTVSAPTASVAQQLMTRHYVEGLALMLGSVLLMLRGLRADRFGWACLAAGAALASMAAKEVFVPLALLLPVLPVPLSGRRRLRLALPLLAAAALYLGWRLVMLGPGNVVTGYGSRAGGDAAAGGWFSLPGWDELWWLGTTAFAALLGIRSLTGSGRQVAVFSLAAGAAVLAPLVTVSSLMAPRYLLVPVAAATLLVALALRRPAARIGAGGLAPLLAAMLIASAFLSLGRSSLWRDRSTVHVYREVGDLVLRGGDDETLVFTRLGSPLYYHSLAWLRQHVLGLAPGPRVCGDACVCGLEGIRTVLQQRGGRLEPGSLAALRWGLDCGDPDAELVVELVYRAERAVLEWSFGPYAGGSYVFAGASGEAEVSGHFQTVPRHGSLPFTLDRPFRFVVGHRSSSGARTDSPILTLDPRAADESGVARLRWRRQAPAPPS